MSDQPELPNPVNTSDTTGIQGGLRPINAPRQGVLVSRKGFQVIGPDYHSPNDETVKLHLYVFHGGTNRYAGEQLLTLQPNVVPFTTQWTTAMPTWVPPRASAYLLYQFKLNSDVESDWYDSGWFELGEPPQITSHSPDNVLEDVRPVFKGQGMPGGFLKFTRTGAGGSIEMSDVGSIANGGSWELALTKNLNVGFNDITASSWIDAQNPGRSVVRDYTFYLLPKPVVSPLPDSGLIREPRPEISGTGNWKVDVDVHKGGDGTTVYGTVAVAQNDTWKVKLTRDLPQGPFHLTGKQRKDGKNSSWATAVSVFGLFPLTITDPNTTEDQDPAFELGGDGGLASADVVVYLDPTSTQVGTGRVSSNGRWNAAISGLIPGARSLTVLQKHAPYTSDRSVPKVFKIRPPKLSPIEVELLPNQAVKFSGDGYDTATLVLSYVSGPVDKKLPEVVVANGRWEVSSTAWTSGTYTYSAIQKVSDNADGWIPTRDFHFQFTIPDPELEPVPDPTNVTYTPVYTPTFSGNGRNQATVLIKKEGGAEAAPDALVEGSRWSSPSSQEWGPTFDQNVDLKQRLDGRDSEGWVRLVVTIPPLAPVITGLEDNDLSPTISGNCWKTGAVVNLRFDDSPDTVESATVTGSTWTFRRPRSFAPNVTHTVFVTQIAAQQTSPPTRREFVVRRTLLKPVIDYPTREIEVERNLTVCGRHGLAGASMQLRIDGINKGETKLLTSDGNWSINLKDQKFGRRILDAQQTLDGRPSELSESVPFHVVLMPPVFTTPLPGGDLPRISTISGEGMPGASVSVWLDGRDDFLLTGVLVSPAGRWEGPVTLPVGVTTLRARQAIEQVVSNDSPLLTCNVVPAAPYIETPVQNGHIGRSTVVSGFGVPGDTVTLLLGDAVLGSTLVLVDRTWSVATSLTQPGGGHVLVAVASYDGFESDRSARLPVVLGSYLPIIDSPQAGRWVDEPVAFSGQGRPGTGQLVSWFNPEQPWAPNLAVNAQGWQGLAVRALPTGGNWCRFKQTIVDGADASTISDWSESGRFEVLDPSSR